MNRKEILQYIDDNFYTKTKNRICIKTENIPIIILNELKSFNKNFNEISLGQMTYNYINNISEVPLCPVCNKPRNFYNIKNGYRISCGSNKCSSTISTNKMLQSRKDNIVINESTKALDITKEDLKVWIKENLYRKDKVIDGNKTDYRKSFYNKNKEYFNTIIKYTKFLDNITISERINIILQDLTKEDYKHLFIEVNDKESLLEWIKVNLFDKTGYLDGNKTERSIKYKLENKDKFDLLEKYTNFLDKDCKTSERIYCLINNIKSKVKCNNPDCDNDVQFNGFNKAYNKYCCWECSRTEETYNLLKETCIEKYDVDNYYKSKESKVKNIQNRNTRIKKQITTQKTNYYNYCLSVYNEDYHLELLSTLEDYKNDNIKFRCKDCKQVYNKKSLILNGIIHHCNNCYPKSSYSTQYELFKILLENDNNLVYEDKNLLREPNSRYSKELDIYSEQYKFAIEYNGLMWHSFGKSKHTKFNNYVNETFDKNKHLEKTELCEEKDIQLFHIFENEWINKDKKNIWFSIINNKMNKNIKVYARKCIIKEIDNKTCNEFLDYNHLQGKVNSTVKLGLYYNNDLVSVMTFGKSRYNKNIEYELLRFCNKLNYSVMGGASKLLKYFERKYKPKSIISYANRRWSRGNLYFNLGFEYNGKSNPNYFYFKDNNLESRVKYQKHKLKDILEVFDENLTESENMYNNDFRKIYDSGNLIFTKIY